MLKKEELKLVLRGKRQRFLVITTKIFSLHPNFFQLRFYLHYHPLMLGLGVQKKQQHKPRKQRVLFIGRK